MDSCPKCGGTSGFSYNLLLKTSMIGFWGENDDEESDAERVRDPETVTCMDCGKRINWIAAHGLEHKHIYKNSMYCSICGEVMF